MWQDSTGKCKQRKLWHILLRSSMPYLVCDFHQNAYSRYFFGCKMSLKGRFTLSNLIVKYCACPTDLRREKTTVQRRARGVGTRTAATRSHGTPTRGRYPPHQGPCQCMALGAPSHDLWDHLPWAMGPPPMGPRLGMGPPPRGPPLGPPRGPPPGGPSKSKCNE